MVTPGCEWAVSCIRRVGVLSSCSLPWVQATIKPATITEVLLEMVDGNDTDLARKAVMNLFFNLFFDAFSKFLYVFCVHRASFLQFLFVVQELFVILQQSYKD